MCWICERLESLIADWNEERELQERTGSGDYHRGLSRGFTECVQDLSDAVASMKQKGVCEKFPGRTGSLYDEERLEILGDLLNLKENGNLE
jgi:hypothetical protein